MKIRWSIIFLALFGVIAAVAAAVLTASLSAQGIQAAVPGRDKDVTIIVAARELKAMETVRQEDLVSKVVPRESAPASYYSDPAQVVGRVLSLPVIPEQPFTKDTFPSSSSGLLLAAHLESGKRAVTLSLNDFAGLDGLIYPGCIVDVIASFKVDASDHIGRAVSTTLLQNIQVLGVENSTVVNKGEEEGSKARASHTGTRRSLLVTLMVDSTQAEALQLAVENGAVSLAMRNPNDVAVSNGQATLLSEGKLAQLADLLSPKMSEKEGAPAEAPVLDAAPKSGELEPLQKDAALPSVAAAAPNGPRFWQIEVIRGMVRTDTPISVQN